MDSLSTGNIFVILVILFILYIIYIKTYTENMTPGPSTDKIVSSCGRSPSLYTKDYYYVNPFGNNFPYKYMGFTGPN